MRSVYRTADLLFRCWLWGPLFLAVAVGGSAHIAQGQAPAPRAAAQSEAAGASGQQPRIGIVFAEDNRPGGVDVSQLYPGGPAARAGLMPGDRIVGADERPVLNSNELKAAIQRRRPGEAMTLSVERRGWVRLFRLSPVEKSRLATLPTVAFPHSTVQPDLPPARPYFLPPPAGPIISPPNQPGPPYSWDLINDPFLRARYTDFTD